MFVGPDGSIQVRDCKENEQLKLPACTISKRAEALSRSSRSGGFPYIRRRPSFP